MTQPRGYVLRQLTFCSSSTMRKYETLEGAVEECDRLTGCFYISNHCKLDDGYRVCSTDSRLISTADPACVVYQKGR